MNTVAVIDYGMGNLRSVAQAVLSAAHHHGASGIGQKGQLLQGALAVPGGAGPLALHRHQVGPLHGPRRRL